MAERFKAPVLKTGDPQGSVGSNPTPSATAFGGAVRPARFPDPDTLFNCSALLREPKSGRRLGEGSVPR